MINFQYVRASTPKGAVDALVKDTTAQFIAGGTNLVDLILAAIADISKTMQMVIENTVDPTSTRDALNYVVAIDPVSQEFPNVQAGERRSPPLPSARKSSR